MVQKVGFSKKSSEKDAVREICMALGNTKYDIVLFCASVQYNFETITQMMVERFPASQVMGTSTCGEISPQGFTDGGIVASGILCPGSSANGIAFEKAHEALFVNKDEIERVAGNCGLKHGSTDGFALVFINALYNAEENVLAVLHAVLGPDFPVVGGSAGDDLQFKQTYVSCNGKVVSDGVAIMFVRTRDKFTIVRENIFRSTGKGLHVTESDPEKRVILSIDNKPPTQRYAQILGVTENELKNNMELQMMGRVFGKNIFVSSIQGFNADGTINLYSRILPNTPVEVLEVIDPPTVIKKTCGEILEQIPHPGVVFMVNCIQRTIRFKNLGIADKIRNIYNNTYNKNFLGFTSYGEQINRIHSNSTLVVLAVKE